MGLGRRGIPPPNNIVPGWLYPGPQTPVVESRHGAGFNRGWTPVSKQIVQKQQTYRRGGVVISSIKYNTHPDIRSLLSLLIG